MVLLDTQRCSSHASACAASKDACWIVKRADSRRGPVDCSQARRLSTHGQVRAPSGEVTGEPVVLAVTLPIAALYGDRGARFRGK
jgi:hypothetical protein